MRNGYGQSSGPAMILLDVAKGLAEGVPFAQGEWLNYIVPVLYQASEDGWDCRKTCDATQANAVPKCASIELWICELYAASSDDSWDCV